jgi:hypothetical protein
VLPSIFGVSPGSVVGAGALNTLPQGKIAKPSAAEIKQKNVMNEKYKAKGLSEWKLIPERKTGAIYTPLTCGLGSFEDAKLSAVASLFKPMERNIKTN